MKWRKRSRINLQLFANPDTGDTGGKDPNAGDDGRKEKVTFTPEQQAKIDEIIEERVLKTKISATKAALEEQAKNLGFANAEEMQNALKEYKAIKDKDKTELQKAQEAKEEAEEKAKMAEDAARTMLIKAAFIAEASKKGFADVEDAFKLADLSTVAVKDDKVEGIEPIVEALAKGKPYLLMQDDPKLPPKGANPSRGSKDADDSVEKAKTEALRRNSQPQLAGLDPWSSGAGASAENIAQIVAATIAALKKEG